MSAFSVQLESLADVVDQLARFERTAAQQLAELDARMSRLHGTWAGAAAQEHRTAHQRWLAGAREMREAIAALRCVSSTAHANYRSAVAANQRMWT